MNELDQMLEINDTLKNKYLTFYIDGQGFGIDIKYVLEIIGIQTITKVPKLPNYIVGIINLRGKVVPLINMRVRFEKENKEYDNKTCIIVVEVDEVTVGLIVDSIDEVLDIPENSITNHPHQELDGSGNYIEGIAQYGKQICMILDCHKILHDTIYE